MRHALAYDNFGRWVVDCPNPNDSNAWEIPLGQRRWQCWRSADPTLNRAAVGCGEEFLVDWPGDNPDTDETITTAVAPPSPTQADLDEAARREHLAQHTAPDGETVTLGGGHTEDVTPLEPENAS